MRLEGDSFSLGSRQQIAESRHRGIASIRANQDAGKNGIAHDIDLPIVARRLVNRDDGRFLMNLCPQFARSSEQTIVKNTSLDCRHSRAGESCAHGSSVNRDEVDRVDHGVRQILDFAGKSEPFQNRQAGRVNAITANFFAGKLFAFDYRNPEPGSGAECSAARSRRAASDNGNVDYFHARPVSMAGGPRSTLVACDSKRNESSVMSWSIPIIRIAGIQLRIHVTFLLLIGWIALGSSSAVIFVLLLFLCVVLHEFGHALAAKAYGINTPDITLLPIGGVARLERIPEEPKQELVIAIAGPLVNVIIAACLYVVIGARGHVAPEIAVQKGDMLAGLFQINVWLLLFNLLPAFPMDGGRVLRALLATRLTYARATQVAATVGQAFAFAFGIVGLFGIPGLFHANPFLIFIAFFVYLGASQEAALAQMRDVSRRFPVSSAMVREFRTLPATATLQEAVDALLATSQHDFPVLDETGNVAGILTRHDLIAALHKGDTEIHVADVMRRDIPTVTTGTRFEEAFRIMQECNCPAVPVLDGMKRLVGLLTPENVSELMMVQSALPRRRPA